MIEVNLTVEISVGGIVNKYLWVLFKVTNATGSNTIAGYSLTQIGQTHMSYKIRYRAFLLPTPSCPQKASTGIAKYCLAMPVFF